MACGMPARARTGASDACRRAGEGLRTAVIECMSAWHVAAAGHRSWYSWVVGEFGLVVGLIWLYAGPILL